VLQHSDRNVKDAEFEEERASEWRGRDRALLGVTMRHGSIDF